MCTQDPAVRHRSLPEDAELQGFLPLAPVVAVAAAWPPALEADGPQGSGVAVAAVRVARMLQALRWGDAKRDGTPLEGRRSSAYRDGRSRWCIFWGHRKSVVSNTTTGIEAGNTLPTVLPTPGTWTRLQPRFVALEQQRRRRAGCLCLAGPAASRTGTWLWPPGASTRLSCTPCSSSSSPNRRRRPLGRTARAMGTGPTPCIDRDCSSSNRTTSMGPPRGNRLRLVRWRQGASGRRLLLQGTVVRGRTACPPLEPPALGQRPARTPTTCLSSRPPPPSRPEPARGPRRPRRRPTGSLEVWDAARAQLRQGSNGRLLSPLLLQCVAAAAAVRGVPRRLVLSRLPCARQGSAALTVLGPRVWGAAPPGTVVTRRTRLCTSRPCGRARG